MPSTKSDRPPAWEVHLSTEARDWLIDCTTDQAALARVMSSFSFIFQKLEIAGPRVGEPDIKKLIAAVAHGRKKSGQSLPRSVVDLAQRKVDAFLAELGANGFIDQDQ